MLVIELISMSSNARNVLVKISLLGLLITLCFSYILFLIIFPEEESSEATSSAVTNLENMTETEFTAPDLLLIPAIGVRAKVQTVGLVANGDGEMAVPNNFTDVGWYGLGTLPGQSGSAVIVGHRNGKGVPEAVFFDLDKLIEGDRITVSDRFGKLLIFTVVSVKVYDFDAPTQDIFLGDKSKIRLNLITC